MDEEMEEFIEVEYEPSEIDKQYEFDASRYFDFSRAESDSEIEEAERWFEIAGDYPPSPFIVKLNAAKGFAVEIAENSSKSSKHRSTKSVSSNSDVERGSSVSSRKNTKGVSSQVVQGVPKPKTSATKSVQPRSSTLMKPTASHLAKQNKTPDMYSSCISRRFQQLSIKSDGKNLQNRAGVDNLETKRQKLEIGYLKKVAQLKHQNLLIHKMSTKVTNARDPELGTSQRAQRRSSKNSSETSECEKPKASTFKARPLNRKILQAPSLSQPKKSPRQLPAFQVFHFKTAERALQHASSDVSNAKNADSKAPKVASLRRTNSRGKPERNEASRSDRARSHRAKIFPSPTDADVQDIKQGTKTLKESKLSTDDSLLQKPPVELLDKLSLGSDDTDSKTVSQPNTRSSGKGSKENAPDAFKPEFTRRHGKLNQCGCRVRNPETSHFQNMPRSLGIH